MSYTGRHRRSLLGRIGSWSTGVIQVVFIFWVTFQSFSRAREAPNLLLFDAGLVGSLVVAVVIHETGHLVTGLAGGEPVRKLRIGSGPTLFGLRIGSLPVQVCVNLLGGGAVYFSASAARGMKRLASLVAGPFVNLLAGAYAVFLYQYTGDGLLGVFALANGICFLSSALPSTSMSGGQEHPSDGMQIVGLLLKPDAAVERLPNFEAAVMTDDARDVLVRAAEDAIFSSSEEITDESLLRALSQDRDVGEMFASTGLTARLPLPPSASNDALFQPQISAQMKSALEIAEKEARNAGFDRLTPPFICLGLYLTDCVAGRLMRDAGIVEDALRRLASSKKDGDDLVTQRVISPDLPLERWGTAADKALAHAARVAVADGSPEFATRHLLAALVADPACRAAQALAKIGFVLEWKPERPQSNNAGEAQHGGPVLSPELGLALAGALWRTGPTFPTGTAELCLGILDQNAGDGAAILMGAGVTVRAIESALRSTPREPSYPAGCTATSRWLWMMRGQARDRACRWLEARADFLEVERTATKDRDRALWRNNIAWVSLMSGDPALRAESLDQARFAVSIHPEETSFVGTYAFALLENGSPGEAASMLESSLPKVTRPHSRAYNLCQLAMCYARMNKQEPAAKNLAAAAEADPECPLLGRARAELEALAA